jgi:hypothetical protein
VFQSSAAKNLDVQVCLKCNNIITTGVPINKPEGGDERGGGVIMVARSHDRHMVSAKY